MHLKMRLLKPRYPSKQKTNRPRQSYL